MHNFNEPFICSECESDRYKLFVDPKKGQGIRCRDCGHEKIVVAKRNKSKTSKVQFRAKIKDNWNKLKKSKTRTF
jgi:DNA-directed RNA polymerase subunit RPC12/RpoP